MGIMKRIKLQDHHILEVLHARGHAVTDIRQEFLALWLAQPPVKPLLRGAIMALQGRQGWTRDNGKATPYNR